MSSSDKKTTYAYRIKPDYKRLPAVAGFWPLPHDENYG